MIRDEVLQESIDYFNGDVLAATVFTDKYALRNNEKEYIEKSPIDMHKRLAYEFYSIEQKYPFSLSYGEIYNVFSQWEIVPQGSVMYGAGNPFNKVSLSNCTVLGSSEDSYAGILDLDQQIVQSAKRRMGYGYDISFLRPRGAVVKNAAQTSTGAVSFLERFSNSTREVAQDGRRGASLASIHINHPDIEEFITIKNDRTKVTGSNISIKLTEDFIDAVKEDRDFILCFPINLFNNNNLYQNNVIQSIPYKELVPYAYGYIKKVRAQDLWNLIIKNAREHSEPGLFLWDKMLDYDPASVYDSLKPVSTNACGEEPMAIGDTCRLIVLNLLKCVDNPFTKNATMNWERLSYLAALNLRLGDDLVDLEIDAVNNIIKKIQNDDLKNWKDNPLKQPELRLWGKIREQALLGRRCGCGFTGMGDMLAALNMRYDSDAALSFIEQVMKTKMRAELVTSIDLAIERGPFKLFNFHKEFDDHLQGQNEFYEMIQEEFSDLLPIMSQYGRRNVNWSTVAPTGSVSILTQTTSGIEPLYKPYYIRRRKIENGTIKFIDQNGDKWEEHLVIHPQFKEWIRLNHSWYSDKSTLESIDILYNISPWAGSCAEDINYLNRIKMQSIVQKYTTAAISSTLNLPEDIMEKEVEDIYLHAYELGCKGVTIYRQNSRSGVLINPSKNPIVFGDTIPPKRPEILTAKIGMFPHNNEKWLAVVGLYEDRPYEIFTGKYNEDIGLGYPATITKIKKNGKNTYWLKYFTGEEWKNHNLTTIFNPEYANYARLVSGMLRHGMPLKYVISVLENLTVDQDHIFTWKNGVIRIFKQFMKDGEKTSYKCPECHGEVIFSEGCEKCLMCSWSRCK